MIEQSVKQPPGHGSYPVSRLRCVLEIYFFQEIDSKFLFSIIIMCMSSLLCKKPFSGGGGVLEKHVLVGKI